MAHSAVRAARKDYALTRERQLRASKAAKFNSARGRWV